MTFQSDESFAQKLDAEDPLRHYRDRFHLPIGPDGQPVIYFAGNSLGLQPKTAREAVVQELEDWARLGVDAHFEGRTPWYPYHEVFRETGARLVGANPGEVVMMNSLTVNLHLMMVSFYRPTRERHKIVIDWPCFPSDIYAVKTQIATHGYDPADALIIAKPREGEHTIRAEDVEATLDREGAQIALVLTAGVNFFTGQVMDMPRLITAARQHGCRIGLDLAHAAGNIPLSLHDWGVDFAVWCSYKYLNSGPGAVAGCFVHERHGKNPDLPRFAGWWGNDPDTRFKMHLLPDFTPRAGADGWQISNPPIMAMAPLKASIELFDEAGMTALRAKSEKLTGYLQDLIDRMPSDQYEVITPSDPAKRGCQLSILAHDDPKSLFRRLQSHRVIGDFREPNVIRVAPVPLYNTFHDVWRFAQILSAHR
ncbi:MAG: kynureninase [Phycisphaerales bacterium]|nr:kynureninase [Phycisphaerales bacterium]